MIGELDQLDEVPAGVQMPWDIAVHRLNVGVVEDETDGRMIRFAHHLDRIPKMMQEHVREPLGAHRFDAQLHTLARHLVGKALEDRKSVVEGKRGSVLVDLGGRRIIKKKKQNNKKN